MSCAFALALWRRCRRRTGTGVGIRRGSFVELPIWWGRSRLRLCTGPLLSSAAVLRRSCNRPNALPVGLSRVTGRWAANHRACRGSCALPLTLRRALRGTAVCAAFGCHRDRRGRSDQSQTCFLGPSGCRMPRDVLPFLIAPPGPCATTMPAPTNRPIDARLCPGPVRLLAGTLRDDISF